MAHSHNCKSSCCSGHSHDDPEIGVQYSLYEKIDMENLVCLNETIEDSGKTVFKSWENRLDFSTFVESDTDEELLFNIPFTGNIKLKGIVVIGDDTNAHPSKVKLYKNRPRMTFDETSIQPDQTFELARDITGVIEYPTKVVSFSSVQHLSLHFPSNYGAETTKIYYIGLKGEFSPAHRHGVTLCTYETVPGAAERTITDHLPSTPFVD